MKEKVNVAELLKDCPKGMELDCTMYDNCTYNGIEDIGYINILIKTPQGQIKLSKEGCFAHNCSSAKCVIFPKGKTTWKGFHKPFKDGDIIFTHANCLQVGLGNTWISIFQENRNGGVATYVDCTEDGDDYYDYIDGSKGLLCMNEDILRQRFATEKEKEKLFDAIKANGYKWNAETKTLEKLIKPKFKVGDRIKHKEKTRWVCTIVRVEDRYYVDGHPTCFTLPFGKQDEYELVPNKFDIATLKPFDKVLTRDFDNGIWEIDFFSRLLDGKHFKCLDMSYVQCIPYEDNEHLLGTTNDCDEYYKTW